MSESQFDDTGYDELFDELIALALTGDLTKVMTKAEEIVNELGDDAFIKMSLELPIKLELAVPQIREVAALDPAVGSAWEHFMTLHRFQQELQFGTQQ